LELDSAERAEFLERECAGDEELRREVESLVASHEEQEPFLSSPAVEVMARRLAEETTLSTSQQIGHYRVLSLLGRGGMGEVYLAQDTRLGRKVALKLLPTRFTQDEDRLRRFVQEAKAASALNHPHIVTIHEIGEDESGRFIVMELVQGQTLRAMNKPCAIESLVNLGGQIARALCATHAAGITHRDIKPDNIMVRDDGYVKILDFGLARLITATMNDPEAAQLAQNSAPGALIGTVAYMSPEQARGDPVTSATDIFALGIVFYELTTGQNPFKADTMIGTQYSITTQSPLPPSRLNPEIPYALDALIARMLEKDTGLRPTAAEVEAALRDISPSLRPSIPQSSRRNTVGRERERAELRSGFASARAGCGLLLCVTGEPGIGKTTLVEDFLAEIAAEGHCAIVRGKCSERLAGAEAYLPLLGAMESLLQGGDGPWAARVMKQLAPTWYTQVVPRAGNNEESTQLLDEIKTASQERMKRELGAFFQEVSRMRPLALFFDDLHWADVSTIDMLNFLAGKFDAMSALIVVAYRPSDMLLAESPFLRIKPELQSRGACRELALEFLSLAEIEQYLALEFPGHRFPPELPKLIHAKTEGSPLFMADLARYLRDRDVIAHTDGAWTLAQTLPDVERELPESMRGMIERKLAQLGEEDRKLLAAASVQGYEFDSAVVAQILGLDDDEVEERLEKLERVYAFVRLISEEEFPNRASTLRYRFVHALYQNALYAGLRATRRVTMSAAVAQSLLGFYGDQIGKVAGELAALFEAARDFARAADHYLLATQNAMRIFAYSESIALARRGLEMLKTLPDSPERIRQELDLQLALGLSLATARGWSTPEVAQAYHRARELCKQAGASLEIYSALYGLSNYYLIRAELSKARDVSEELLRLAGKDQDSDRIIAARFMLGSSLLLMGDLVSAEEHFKQSLELYHPGQSIRRYTFLSEPGIACYCHLSRALWLLGFPHKALERIRQAIALARLQSDPRSLGYTIGVSTFVFGCLNDYPGILEHSEAVRALARDKDIADYLAWAKIPHGYALAMQDRMEEGIAEMHEGLATIRMFSAEACAPERLAYLVIALMKARRIEEGLAHVAEALAIISRTEERYWEAEIYRLKGALLLQSVINDQPSAMSEKRIEAEACFQKAIEVARRQQARSLELRATMSLARLWREQGKTAEARRTLAEIYGWFTEGFDTSDLREAEALLEELVQQDAPSMP
jgi:serine/threonine protein kinase/predicted ATPase